MNNNLYELYFSRFAGNLDDVAIETLDGNTILYRELDAAVASLSRMLSDSGVSIGDRVAVQVDKSPEALLLYLACIRAGFIYLPLNTAYQTRELEYFLADAEPTVVVCRSQSFETVQRLCTAREISRVHTLDADGSGSLFAALMAFRSDSEASVDGCAEFTTAHRDADDVACILYTSGTTGQPKGAMITHGNLATNGLKLHEAWGFVPGDVLLHALPLFHVHGIFVACGTALLNASRMIFLPKFDTEVVIQKLADATVFMGVPTFYVRLLDDPNFNQQSCRNIRLFTAGSAPLLAQTFEAFEQRTGHRIVERYGMTETEMTTSNPVRWRTKMRNRRPAVARYRS